VNIVSEVAAEAFRRGASAYVLKHSAAEELLIAIRTVVRGESYLSPLIARETVTFLLNQAKPQRTTSTSPAAKAKSCNCWRKACR